MNNPVPGAIPQVRTWNRRWALGRFGFAVLLVVIEAAIIIAASVLTGVGYHLAAYGNVGEIANFAAVGISTSLVFSLPVLIRDDDKFQDYLEGRRAPGRTFILWNCTFLCLGFIGLLTKTTGVFSRGWLVAFYFVGLIGVIALEEAVSRILAAAIASGRVASRRLMLVGAADEIARITAAVEQPGAGLRVVGSAALPLSTPHDTAAFQTTVADAVDKARALGADDVVILTDWSRGELIEDLVESFTVLPVAIHLGAAGVIGRFSAARVARFGAANALSLTAPPLGPLQSATKRIFDVTVASLALLLLAPLLVLIAVAIRIDSRGPIFFRQRRRGYNLREFRIWKFRTMTTLDDGDVVVQARAGDHRITRIGAVLRRLNFDELPQLFNVIAGEMSLVGPRPHAVAHDAMFETRIAKYRRRLNVRPGITGWAQVNGLRGPTETDAAMAARVDYDLYYIDNWSIGLDIYVMFATVLSRKAYHNAV